MRTKITRTIISDENIEFEVGNDVHFYLNRNDKMYSCFGIITSIEEDIFQIDNVQIDKMNVSDELSIKYSEVKDGILHYTDNSWC